jgi:phage/plasmid-associated DNA primase
MLEEELRFYKEKNADLLWRCELREKEMYKAWRERDGANKGIRRLKAKLKKYEGHDEGADRRA